MEIVLNNSDLEVIDGLIKKTPFEFANPFYTFFVGKIQEQQARLPTPAPSVAPALEGNVQEEPKKAPSKLKKA